MELIDTRLSEFGIIREIDIIASTTDGAAMMKKFGRLLKCENQSCHAHGIHLAVVDVLYKKTPVQELDAENEESADEEEVEEGNEEGEVENEAGEGDIREELNINVPPFSDSMNDLLKKVRYTVTRPSP